VVIIDQSVVATAACTAVIPTQAAVITPAARKVSEARSLALVKLQRVSSHALTIQASIGDRDVAGRSGCTTVSPLQRRDVVTWGSVTWVAAESIGEDQMTSASKQGSYSLMAVAVLTFPARSRGARRRLAQPQAMIRLRATGPFFDESSSCCRHPVEPQGLPWTCQLVSAPRGVQLHLPP